MAILFQTQGAPEVRKFLAQGVARAKDPRPALKDAGEEMLVRTQKRMRAGRDVNGLTFKASKGAERRGGQTLWDRGALAASAQYTTDRAFLELFSTDKRARVHYEGLTITPKKAKFLTIPLRARGGMFSGPDTSGVANANRTGGRARHFKNVFFLRRGRNLFLMQRVGWEPSEKGKRRFAMKRSGRSLTSAVRALFILVRSVNMPRREWLGFHSTDVEMVAQKVADHIGAEKK